MKHKAAGIVTMAMLGAVAASCSSSNGTTVGSPTGDGGGQDGTTGCGGTGEPCCNGTACNVGFQCVGAICSSTTSGDGGGDSGGDASATDAGADAASDTGTSPEAGGDGSVTEAGRDGSSGGDGSSSDGSSDGSQEAGGDACAASGTGAVGTLGCPCSPPGELACNGNDQKVTLICSGGIWTYSQTCQVGDNCNSAPGSNQGLCLPIEALCASATPGQDVCSNDTTVVQCGPDLVSILPVTSCVNQACVSGACTGVCSPGAINGCTGSAVNTCNTSGQWAPVACTPPLSCIGSSASALCGDLVYANTDGNLYTLDPKTLAVTLVGPFAGMSGSATDSSATDLAVDQTGVVYVNTESVVYRATVPTTPGTVQLTKLATIQGSDRFYALAFAPVGALDPSVEVLVGGDSSGNLWSIDTGTGAVAQLGNFGPDPSTSGNVLGLSGDMVFYLDSGSSQPWGLATIRSCPSGGGTCSADYLATVNMTSLKAAYESGTPAATLLGGIYGGSGSNLGAGTGYHNVFGLGAWNSTVFGFTRQGSSTSAALISIDTTTGAGTTVQTFAFSGDAGWAGAGVTTKALLSVPTP